MVMDKIALTLLIIGGLNWGSVGLFQFDLVAFACGGAGSLVSRVVYALSLIHIWIIPQANTLEYSRRYRLSSTM